MVTREKVMPAKIRIVFVWALLLLGGCSRVIPTTQLTPTVEPASIPAPTPTIEGTIIPFETINKEIKPDLAPSLTERNPKLIILSKTKDIGNLEGNIRNEALGILQNVDFNHELVIAVFQGDKSSTGFEVEVQQVIFKNDGVNIVVNTEFKEPIEGEDVVQHATTSPYHLIKIRKEGLSGRMNFILKSRGVTIYQVEATINQEP